MSFKTQYPQFAPIEQHIRRANAQRAVHLATLIADALFAVVGGLRRLLPTAAPAAKAPRAPKRLVVKARLVPTARY